MTNVDERKKNKKKERFLSKRRRIPEGCYLHVRYIYLLLQSEIWIAPLNEPRKQRHTDALYTQTNLIQFAYVLIPCIIQTPGLPNHSPINSYNCSDASC